MVVKRGAKIVIHPTEKGTQNRMYVGRQVTNSNAKCNVCRSVLFVSWELSFRVFRTSLYCSKKEDGLLQVQLVLPTKSFRFLFGQYGDFGDSDVMLGGMWVHGM